jgi:RNA polymerase sigma-70 factor (ECF subfamily)
MLVHEEKPLLMKSDNQNDNFLWLQFKAGNKNAFAEIYHTFISSLIAYGAKLCADEESLKDNIQDLFIELWNSREKIAQPDYVKFYLFKALRYKLIRADKVRQLRTSISYRESHADNGSYNKVVASVETKIVDEEILNSQISSLRVAINGLTKRQQEVIQLKFYQGFSNEQIADLMQINYQSISNLLHTALYRIKKNLKSSPVFTTAILAAIHFFI